jgi:cytoskeletal protein CcmA (bactofilin family)
MIDEKSVVPAAGDRKTLVEEGSQFKGSLTSSCPIVVRGRIEGDVQAPSLTISSSGAVHGKVRVDELRSQGELSGECDADVVQLSGSVKDNTIIRAKSLEVKLVPASGKMQVVFGECTLEVGDPSAKASEGAKAAAAAPAKAAAPVPAKASAPPPGEVVRPNTVPPPGEGAQ